MKQALSLILLLAVSVHLHAQDRVVRGKLTVFNHYPVANVEVMAKKSKTSVTTDLDGRFEIVCQEKDILQVKNKLFAPWNTRVGKKDEMVSANLVFKDSPKNREIATGLGYISEEQLNYALAHLEHENNDFCNYVDVFSLIKGKFTGVEVKTSSSGGPGVFVRGQKSLLGDSETLYVVDGVRVSDLTFINPCNMISIDILKDAAATIYGAQGANGVVVIETKAMME
jgi:TonB-dependent SusC/RagA subfamily outer membrane receptor